MQKEIGLGGLLRSPRRLAVFARATRFLGPAGIALSLLSYLHLLESLVSQILDVVLLTLLAYELDLPRRASGIQRAVRARLWTAVAGTVAYSYFRYDVGDFLSGYLVLLVIVLLLVVIASLANQVPWNRLPRKIAQRIPGELVAPWLNDGTLEEREVLFLWGIGRTSFRKTIRFVAVMILLLPYFLGLIGSTIVLAVVDVVIPSCFISSSALLLLAAFRLRRKTIRPRETFFRMVPKTVLRAVRSTWNQYNRDEKLRQQRLIRAFADPRALFYVILALLTSVAGLRGLLALSFLVGPFQTLEAIILPILLAAGALPTLVIPAYYAWKQVFSLARSHVLTVMPPPWGFVAASCVSILVLHKGLTIFSSSLIIMGPNGQRTSIPAVLIVLAILGASVLLLMWLFKVRQRESRLTRKEGLWLAILLTTYVTLTLFVRGTSYLADGLVLLASASCFYFAGVTGFRISITAPPRGGLKRGSRYFVGAFAAAAADALYLGNAAVVALTFAGAIFTSLLTLSDATLVRITWIVLGVRVVPHMSQAPEKERTR